MIKNPKHALTFIFIILLIDMVGIGGLFAFSTIPGNSFYFPGTSFILGGVMISSSIFFIYPVLKKTVNLENGSRVK